MSEESNNSSKTSKPKIKWGLGIVVLILIILFIISRAFLSNKSSKSESAQDVSTITKIPVKVELVKKAPHQKSISAQGTLLYSQKANLISQQPGNITKIFFKNGQKVNSGELLIQIDDKKLKQDMIAKKALYSQKKDLYERYRKLNANKNKQGFLSAAAITQAKQDYLAAKADYTQAEVAVAQTKIRAPFKGVMGALANNINIGSQVNTSDTLVTIFNPDSIEVTYQLNQKYFNRIKLGQVTQVYLKPKKIIDAKVSYIAPQVDSLSNSFEVRALLEPSKYGVAGGMLVMIKQTLPKVKDAILIPGLSIITDSAGFSVFIVKENKAVAVPVKLGESIGNKTVIKYGLRVGDKLIIDGQQKVSDGSLVIIK
jgi:RND family efflux transporter MFP subunit